MSKDKQSNIMDELLSFSHEKFKSVHALGDLERMLTGIPLPGLALRWLLESNVLPLGQLIGLAGPPKSHKSSLGYELMRWTMLHGGQSLLFDTEGKISADLLPSILGEQLAAGARAPIHVCESVEDAQKRITATLDFLRKKNVKDMPFCLMLDSIAGVSAEGRREKILGKVGHAEQDFPREALAWTSFFNTIPSALTDWPYLMVYVNHLKEKPQSKPGHAPSKISPGGMWQYFRASLVLWLKRGEVSHDAQYANERHMINIQCYRSSIGADGRDIDVPFVRRFGEDGRQISEFGWDEATAILLCENSPNKEVAEICHVTADNKSSYNCSALGMKKVHPKELGQAIHANEAMYGELQRVLHIKQHPVFGEKPVKRTEKKKETADA